MTIKIEPILYTDLLPEWGDSPGVASLGGYIHAIGQARRAIYGSSKHYAINPATGGIVADIDAPFTPTAEWVACVKGNEIFVHSGTTDYSIWKFSPSLAGLTAGSWSNVSLDTSAELGQSPMASGGYCPLTNKFYKFGGFQGVNYFRSTTMLDGSWEDMGPMPVSIQKLSACAWCYYNGKFYFFGGANNLAGTSTADLYEAALSGEVWSYDTAADEWNLEHTDRLIFGCIWCDCAPLVVDGELVGFVFSRGLISPAQLTTFDAEDINVNVRQANNRGVYISKGLDLTKWRRIDAYDSLDVLAHETHRRGMVSHGNYVLMYMGFNDNGLLRVSAIPSAPVVLTQPVDTLVNVGSDDTLTLLFDVEGYPDPTIQVQKSTNSGATWANIPGATSGDYSQTVTVADDGMMIRFVATNDEGTVTSDEVTITVINSVLTGWAGTYEVSGTTGGHTGHSAASGAGLRDGNYAASNSIWAVSTTNGWIRVDLGAVRLVDKIRCGPILGSAGWGALYHNGAVIQISNDGAAWTTVDTLAGHVEGSVKEYVINANARYVRLFKATLDFGVGDFFVDYWAPA